MNRIGGALAAIGILSMLAAVPFVRKAPTASTNARSEGATRGMDLAARYPGDAGIESDPDVLFVERFDEGSLPAVFKRWTDVRNAAMMSLDSDVPFGGPGSRSLDIGWIGGGA